MVINARAESVFAKKMFANSAASKRCIIPASGFYEWDASKNKFHFKDGQKGRILYMAGIYHMEENVNKFVIITTAAKDILDAVPPLLNKEAEVEQLRLEF